MKRIQKIRLGILLVAVTYLPSTLLSQESLSTHHAKVHTAVSQTHAKTQKPSTNNTASPQQLKQKFIDRLVKQHHFDRKSLNALFAKIKIKPLIIKTMRKPAESLAWYQYQAHLITPKRINAGKRFMRRYAKTLKKAEKQYGVPANIITAILGIETYYGKITGSYRVIDALATLGFYYPPRAPYFQKELEAFLKLARDEKLSPLTIKGSYAGAMGPPQFMPSSYQEYAIDFSRDGKRDLIHNMPDAIGSIAHYLNRHGWQKHQPITDKTHLPAHHHFLLYRHHLKRPNLARSLQKAGLHVSNKLKGNTKVGIMALDVAPNKTDYWLAYPNFHVITSYNHSILYAMAVSQLAHAIYPLD